MLSRFIPILLVTTLFVAACVPTSGPEVELSPAAGQVVRPSPQPLESPTEGGETRLNVRVDDPNTYRFPQLIPPDGIRPVYNPEFAPGDQVDLQDDELILGVAFGGEAKAYPITVLRSREMVNDELAGIPTLVTW